MKPNRYFILAFLLLCVGFVSCQEEDELNVDDYIYGLGGDTGVSSDLDKWLHENYVEPYNIEVKYRWSTYDVNTTAQLVPIHRNLVKPMMEMIRDVWFSPYEKTAGDDFTRMYPPKLISLIGSPEYNDDGSKKLGQAEGANKITLFDCNSYNPADEAWLRELLATIEHEFAHILHQTRAYDKSFKSICAGSYNPTGWINENEVTALMSGFLSPYSMSGVDEDFVEIISLIMVYGPEWLQDRYDLLNYFITMEAPANETPEETKQRIALSAQASQALDRLQKKIQIVSDYMKTTWGIQFFDVAGGEKGLVGYVQDAIDKVLTEGAANRAYVPTDDEQ